MTARGVRVLGQALLIAAEDTRVTRRLLAHLGIRTRLVSYHQHNWQAQLPKVLHSLESGDAALVCGRRDARAQRPRQRVGGGGGSGRLSGGSGARTVGPHSRASGVGFLRRPIPVPGVPAPPPKGTSPAPSGHCFVRHDVGVFSRPLTGSKRHCRTCWKNWATAGLRFAGS